jgi:hypothetical protein
LHIFTPPGDTKGDTGQSLWTHDEVRPVAGGLGIVVSATEENLQIPALSKSALFEKMFELVGIRAERSQPGIIAENLIRQLGGLQGCRVFKIPGVRELITKYKSTESFTSSEAKRILFEKDFNSHRDLYIKRRRTGTQLTVDNVFTYLLERKVFRAGLELRCPNCQLKFWKHIDDCETMIACDYCGTTFDMTLQLRDRGDWRYRRSGLFGREDHQQGAITVVLSLQQLETSLHEYPLTYSTGLNLQDTRGRLGKCEVDFLIITENRDGVQVGLSECKTNQEITAVDVSNLSQVADALGELDVQPFLIFCKTGTFSETEIGLLKEKAAAKPNRFILLSGRELEPYGVYERAREQFAVDTFGGSLQAMADATRNIFFDPKLRSGTKR